MAGSGGSSPWSRGLEAARANARPAVCLQLAALALFLSYALWPAGRRAFEEVAIWKLRFGWGFSMVSTATFGALIPWLLEPLQQRSRPRTGGRELGWLVLFWAYKGLEVDAFYRLQSLVVGSSVDVPTIASKVVIDQLVYAPLLAIPGTVVFYHWKDRRGLWPASRPGPLAWFRRHCVVILVLNWMVWLPSVIGIYCLPLPLQLPVQNLVLCMWCLMLMFLTRPVTARV